MKLHLKVKKKIFLYMLFFIAFVRPEYLLRSSIISIFYNYYRIAVVGMVFALFLAKRKAPSKFSLMWIVFETLIVVSTLLHAGNISFAINQALTIVALAFFMQIYSDDMYDVCKALYWLLGILIVINFITLILYPSGMYVTGVTNKASANWFLGFKNKHMIYFLPFVGLNFIFSKTDGWNLKKIFMLVIVVISSIVENSSTTIVALSFMVIIGLIPFIRKQYKIFNMYTYFGISILMFIVIPLFRLQYVFAYLIINVLNKSVDLSYRTDLWDRAFDAIRQHPLIGWGEQTNEVKHILYNSQSVISAHNQILEYIYMGGIVLIILYIIINLMIAKKMHKNDTTVIIQIAAGIYLALQIALIVEVYADTIIYFLYFLLWYVNKIPKKKERKV